MSLFSAILNEIQYGADQIRQGRPPYTNPQNNRQTSGRTNRGGARGFNPRQPAPGRRPQSTQFNSGRGFNPRQPAPGTTVRSAVPIPNILQRAQQGFSNVGSQIGSQTQQLVRGAGQGLGQVGNTIYNAAAGQFSPYSRAATAGSSPLPQIVSTARNVLAPVGSVLGGTGALIAGAPAAFGAGLAAGGAAVTELVFPRPTSKNDTLWSVPVTAGGRRSIRPGSEAVLNGIRVRYVGPNGSGHDWEPVLSTDENGRPARTERPGMVIAGSNGPIGTTGLTRVFETISERFIKDEPGQPRFGDIDPKTGNIYSGRKFGYQTPDTHRELLAMHQLGIDIDRRIKEGNLPDEVRLGRQDIRYSSEVHPGLKPGQRYRVGPYGTIVRYGSNSSAPPNTGPNRDNPESALRFSLNQKPVDQSVPRSNIPRSVGTSVYDAPSSPVAQLPTSLDPQSSPTGFNLNANTGLLSPTPFDSSQAVKAVRAADVFRNPPPSEKEINDGFAPASPTVLNPAGLPVGTLLPPSSSSPFSPSSFPAPASGSLNTTPLPPSPITNPAFNDDLKAQLINSITAPQAVTLGSESIPVSLQDYYAVHRQTGAEQVDQIVNALNYNQANRPDLAAWARNNPLLAQRELNKLLARENVMAVPTDQP